MGRSGAQLIHPAHAYVPIDRQVALALGRDLPTHVRGSVLEADLSGFTALTESLAQELGEQRGAEELARRLNVMYDGLLHEVHRYGGTVLGFSGDAFTCWLDRDDGRRAVACAQALQAWMSGYAERTVGVASPKLKVAIATGATRRFVVGDPGVQLLEGLAGALVDEVAAAEHEAEPGDIVLAASTRASLGARVETGERGVLRRADTGAPAAPWPELDLDPADVARVRAWLLPAVFERLVGGEGDFLAELRPATAMFLRFSGIGFESEADALDRLDVFVRAVQGVLTAYGGTLVQLTIGDKGSYLYAAFGAPVAHEDDTTRALLAALELRKLGARRRLVAPVSIGVASGRLRAGAYGGSERRTYGVLGDTVNLSARLMQAARPGEIIATSEMSAATAPGFRWSALSDLVVKGKSAPVAVARLVGRRAASPRRRTRTLDAMLGRQEELAALESALEVATAGQGRIVAVTAEAGMGKTRLVSELVRLAERRGVTVHMSECPSFGVNGSYVVWRPVFQRLMGRRPGVIGDALARVNPALRPRLPLLGALLGLAIPDNELTGGMDAKVRKTSLEATLAEWLRASVERPTMIVLEDCHWIDSLSEDLLEVIGRTCRELPVLVVLTQRPRDETEGGELAIARQPHYEPVPLGRLTDDDVSRLIRRRLEATPVPKAVADDIGRLAQRAEGNPFYVGELLEYIIGLGPAAADPARLAELPSSLQSLILSRIDQLDERPRSTLKVASAMGRVFDPALLAPSHRELGTDTDVDHHLSALATFGFVLPEREQTWAFKHAITQEVTYSTILGETRAALHGRIGRVLEDRLADDRDGVERQLDLLAHHFGRGDDEGRRRVYVLRAGDAAQARYANRAAIGHFRNVLPVLDEADRGEVLLKLGRALGLVGAWDEATAAFAEAETVAVRAGDVRAEAWARAEQAELWRKLGRYGEAITVFDDARAKLESVGDSAGVAEVLHLEGTLAAQQGQTALARSRYEASLQTRERLGDRRGMARSLNGLGIVAEYENELGTAAALYERALTILTELGDTWGVAALTNNAGMALLLQGLAGEARPLFERAVALQREVGDPHMLANFLSNMGDAARELGDPDGAMRCYEESLVMSRELGERWLITYLLEDVAMLAASEGRPGPALRLAAAGARLRQEIGAPLPAESQRKLDERLEPARRAMSADEANAVVVAGGRLSFDEAIEEALSLRNEENAVTGQSPRGQLGSSE